MKANHNLWYALIDSKDAVSSYAKLLKWKQITTARYKSGKYDKL